MALALSQIIRSSQRIRNDQDTSDVSFNVNDECFTGHRAILMLCAPTLDSLCKTYNGKPVPISAIDTEIFRSMLRYVYGGQIPKKEIEKNAPEFIDAADKYGELSI